MDETNTEQTVETEKVEIIPVPELFNELFRVWDERDVLKASLKQISDREQALLEKIVKAAGVNGPFRRKGQSPFIIWSCPYIKGGEKVFQYRIRYHREAIDV